MAEKRVIGTTQCHDCKATIEIRVDAKGRCYSMCDGTVDNRLCHASRKWSAPKSRRMIQAAEAEAAGPAAAPEAAVVEKEQEVERDERSDWGGW